MTKSPTGALLTLALVVAVALTAIDGNVWPVQWWLIATPITLLAQPLARWSLHRQAAVDRKRAVRLVLASEVATTDGSRHRVAEVLERARELTRLAERLEHQSFDLEPRPVGAQVEATIARFRFSETRSRIWLPPTPSNAKPTNWPAPLSSSTPAAAAAPQPPECPFACAC